MANITNREIKKHYEILDTLSAGISLLGTEVKSIRTGKGSLMGAKVVIRAGEVLLSGANIPPYQEKNSPASYDPKRTRKLLLNKREIQKLYLTVEAKNLTLVPIKVYNVGRHLKLEIGIARKKNARDKREEIKQRDAKRTIRRESF